MFDRLKGFKVVGWDFDDTLVNHPRSEMFWKYIAENPLNQVHYIVTMRTHDYKERIFSDLVDHGSQLDREHFALVITPPDELWVSHEIAKSLGKAENHPYLRFKAEACKKHGIEVLIDDMEMGALTTDAFAVNGIVHIDPDHL